MDGHSTQNVSRIRRRGRSGRRSRAIIARNFVRPSATCALTTLHHQLHQLRLRGCPTEGRRAPHFRAMHAAPSTSSTSSGPADARYRDHWDHSPAERDERRFVSQVRTACFARSFRYRALSFATIRPPPWGTPHELGEESRQFFCDLSTEEEPRWPSRKEKHRLRSATCAAATMR